MHLYGHPFSSYTQKALIALYENASAFELRLLSPEQAENGTEFARRWPLKRFPLLVDGQRQVMEATSIIEYLELRYPGTVRLIPDDAERAGTVRMLDRIFDNYVHAPLQKIVFDALRPAAERDARGVADARQMLDTAYAWIDQHMSDRPWAAGEAFSLADCAAAPALFYADWAHGIRARLIHLREYRARLIARSSFARCIEQARPYRSLFPLGAPARD